MAPSVPTTRLRLDRSRPFGTIHGERTPGDAHQFAHFTQDGIHFDSQGLHLEDLIADDKTRTLVDRRLKKAGKAKPDAEDASEGEEDAPPQTGSQSGTSDVNLEAWLRGEAKYQFFSITKTVRERYHQNMSKLNDIVVFLVEDEKVVPVADLSAEFAAIIGHR